MRIAIFDSILESHVAESLERAFIRRGHQVYSTGHIGSGYAFPRSNDHIDRLAAAVSRTLAFKPDLIFVMRPASLPFPLLEKLKSSSAQLMAWFSDDPVLFDLSYGPIVSSYDHIIHCGNARVLEFYEDYFGRPTGINLPFWTDHEAFPLVWGRDGFDVDFMFLGNVHDNVRRARYFELGQMKSSLRLHGAAGVDYFGISGGYLDNDEEVVASAARARMALNIPQFFVNHRGLETWFPGLDQLGFFEYPSRVIQYMAMGLPTISIIPDGATFRSYPEMFVAHSIDEADALAQELIRSNGLPSISAQVSERFDRFFSADARALAIESLLVNDEWKSLDAQEREVYFLEFDARSTSSLPETSAEVEAPIVLSTGSELAPAAESSDTMTVAVLSNAWDIPTARCHTVVEALEARQHRVVQLDSRKLKGVLVPDPGMQCQYALNVSTVLASNLLPGVSLLVATDLDVVVTASGRTSLHESGTRFVYIDDTHKKDLQRALRLASQCDALALQSYAVYKDLQNCGFTNVLFSPASVRADFVKYLDELETSHPLVHVRESVLSEEETTPAFLFDARGFTSNVFTYDELLKLPLDKLASVLKSAIALMSHHGRRAHVRISSLAPYVALASQWLFVQRRAVWQETHPYDLLGISVSGVGELASKAQGLLNSPTLQQSYQQRRDAALPLITQEISTIEDLIALSQSQRNARSSQQLLKNNLLSVPVPQVPRDVRGAYRLRVDCTTFVGNHSDWWIKIRLDGKAVHGYHPNETNSFLINAFTPDKNSLEVELLYLGASRAISAERSCSVSVALDRVADVAIAAPNAVTELPPALSGRAS